MGKNIALFFDGTWNQPRQPSEAQANTNVWKLHNACEKSSAQLTHYIWGVGTSGRRAQRLAGGVGGYGISANIQEGYEFLVEHYDHQSNDHIYLFGFSRGAYTARSLAGFVEHVGILLKGHIERVPEAFQLYKSKATVEDSKLWPFVQKVLGQRRRPEGPPLRVYFVGVWDTVGRLGAPGPLHIITDPEVKFHNTDLPQNVTHARQALAIHELRKTFEPVLWSGYDSSWQTLQQVWFAGAHCDVGGGYDETGLSDIAMCWMAAEARQQGLSILDVLLKSKPDYKAELHHQIKGAFAGSTPAARAALDANASVPWETIQVHESAAHRLLGWKEGQYQGWKRAIRRQLERIDRRALYLMQWLAFERARALATCVAPCPARASGLRDCCR